MTDQIELTDEDRNAVEAFERGEKQCKTCEEVKPLSEYRMREGRWYLGDCRDCIKAKDNANYQKNRERRLRKEREKYWANHEEERQRRNGYYNREQAAVWRDENRDVLRLKSKARDALRYAIRTGRVIRPDTCEDCSRGGPIEAHHPDYNKPFDVEWLCRKCHGTRHRKVQDV